MSGVFADAPVVGLSYSCGSQTGVTATGGTFTCATASTVTFKVGGVTICTGTAQPFMTPVSCAQATDSTANTSTPSVIAVARFLQSISTTPASSGTLTITSAELQAAANLNLNFATAGDAELQAAVSTIKPGATLVDATTAQAQLLTTVNAGIAGTYKGSFSAPNYISGDLTLTVDASGHVTGTATPVPSNGRNPAPVQGNLVTGTSFTGVAGDSATWTGTLDTSRSPAVLSGHWQDNITGAGTFTASKQ